MRLTLEGHGLVHVRAPDDRQRPLTLSEDPAHGAGPSRRAILFLHGAGGTSLAFLAVSRKLAGQAGCFLMDFPGHGGSPGPAPDSIEGFADVAAAAAAALGIVPCAVVGHSMGAAVAVQMALSRPALVSALGLVCAELPLRVHPDLRAALSGSSERVAEVFARVGHSPTTPASVARANAAPIAATSTAVLRADLAACERYDPRAQLAALRVPTAVLAGADDAITPVEGARGLAQRIAGARLVVVPAAGHMLPVEQPQACAVALGELLAAG